MTGCNCFRCTKARVAVEPGELLFGQPTAMMRMFLCETCGNKRCPHAADHRQACTHSNAVRQPGSLYETSPRGPPSDTSEPLPSPREDK